MVQVYFSKKSDKVVLHCHSICCSLRMGGRIKQAVKDGKCMQVSGSAAIERELVKTFSNMVSPVL